ncbi:MAG: AzlD domain-containing protein [Anaerolineae bacterium]
MSITLLILALALGTYTLRFLPLTVLSRANLPEWAHDWLSLVPGAVLAASLAQSLLIQDERLALSMDNAFLLAAVPTFLVAWRTRNVILTMLTGMTSYALLDHLIL